MFCKYCGSKMQDGANVCPNCQRSQGVEIARHDQGKKGGKGFLRIVILIALLLIAGFGVMMARDYISSNRIDLNNPRLLSSLWDGTMRLQAMEGITDAAEEAWLKNSIYHIRKGCDVRLDLNENGSGTVELTLYFPKKTNANAETSAVTDNKSGLSNFEKEMSDFLDRQTEIKGGVTYLLNAEYSGKELRLSGNTNDFFGNNPGNFVCDGTFVVSQEKTQLLFSGNGTLIGEDGVKYDYKLIFSEDISRLNHLNKRNR